MTLKQRRTWLKNRIGKVDIKLEPKSIKVDKNTKYILVTGSAQAFILDPKDKRFNKSENNMLTRKEIWEFKRKVQEDRDMVLNPDWIRAYEVLLTGLDHVDACIARSTEVEKTEEK